jgi:hypothetical protein
MGMSPADFYPPGPPTAGPAADQVARDAAAAAQSTANAAVSTAAELVPLLADPTVARATASGIAADAGATASLAALYDRIPVRDLGIKHDGSDETATFRAILAANGAQGYSRRLLCDAPIKLGPMARLNNTVDLAMTPDAYVSANVGPGTVGTFEPLFDIGGPASRFEGVTVDYSAMPTTTVEMKSAFMFRSTAKNSTVRGVTVKNGIGQDLPLGQSAIKTVDAFYCEGADDLLIERCVVSNIAGCGAFFKDAARPRLIGCHMTDTGWYSMTFDQGITDGVVERNVFDGEASWNRNKGGAINFMSLQTGAMNQRCVAAGNFLSGKYNYGSVIRVLSPDIAQVVGNHIYGCTQGGFAPVGALQAIALDTRGVDSTNKQHPFRGVVIARNVVEPAAGQLTVFIYCKNQYWTNNPAVGLVIAQNQQLLPRTDPGGGAARTVDATAQCVGIQVHGQSGGIAGLDIVDNVIETVNQPATSTGSTNGVPIGANTGTGVGGGMGISASDANGTVYGHVAGNRTRDYGTPARGDQVGLFLTGYAQIDKGFNHHDGHQYGRRNLLTGGQLRSHARDRVVNSTFEFTDTAVTVGRPDETKQALAYAASITPDPTSGSIVEVGVLTGGISVLNPAAPADNQTLELHFVQDATGTRTVSFGSAFKLSAALGAGTASQRAAITFRYLSSAAKWIERSRTAWYT